MDEAVARIEADAAAPYRHRRHPQPIERHAGKGYVTGFGKHMLAMVGDPAAPLAKGGIGSR
jgi:hypothetical protein